MSCHQGILVITAHETVLISPADQGSRIAPIVPLTPEMWPKRILQCGDCCSLARKHMAWLYLWACLFLLSGLHSILCILLACADASC